MKHSINPQRNYNRWTRFSALSIWLFVFMCCFSLPSIAQPPTPTCPEEGVCDEVVIYDTLSTNCYRFRITNVGKMGVDTAVLGAFSIFMNPALPNTVQWICTEHINNSGITGYSGPMDEGSWKTDYHMGVAGSQSATHEKFYIDADTSALDTASLRICDSGFFEICFCCLNNKQVITVPITFRTYYIMDSLIVDSCDHAFDLDIQPQNCEGSWECDEACDDLSISGPTTDPVTGEVSFCATISQKTAGELRSFSLNFDCISTTGSSDMRGWRIKSMPEGWLNSSISSGGASFVDTTTTGTATGNCEDLTICFTSEGCGTYCDSVEVSLETFVQADTCNVSALLVLPGIDNSCCLTTPLTIGASSPVQDPVTGKWAFCIKIHRAGSDADDTMSNVTICYPNPPIGRCVELTSIPVGWELISTATVGPNTCLAFKRTTAPNSGCRTFEWCFQTCDCKPDQSFTMNFKVSGDNIVPQRTVPVVIPADGGHCCEGKWYRQDDVQVTPVPGFARCMDFTLLNANCEYDLNDFHFTVPCDIVSVNVISPAGFVAGFVGNQVNVIPAPSSTAKIDCCEKMIVRVCYDNCEYPFMPFTTNWRSTWNGTTITDSLQNIAFGGPIAPPQLGTKGISSPTAASEQNFPNPVSSANDFKTMIPFSVEGTGVAEIIVTNAKGDIVLRDGMDVMTSGKHFFFFTGKELPAGSYYYQIQFPKGEKVIVQRSLLIVK